MASAPQPSFSARRRFAIGLNVTLTVLVVFAVVVMVNYLAREYFTRFHWSTRTKIELSPLTVKFLGSLTNRVKVTLYYDPHEAFFSTVTALLNEYHLVNSRISVDNIDYLRDAGAAQRIKAQYKLTLPTATNLIIFDCEGRSFPIDGNALTRYELEPVANAQEREFRRKPIEFQGERMFTSALLAVANPKPLNAYFLEGHGEHPMDSDEKDHGYEEFASIVRMNYIQSLRLPNLLGTNAVPADCHLLVIAGPRDPISEPELEKIDQYLNQGGRLLALFSYRSIERDTGLERILARWGVEVGNRTVVDTDNSLTGYDVIISDFARHPLVDPLLDSRLHLVKPRAIARLRSASGVADAPHVEEVAFSGPNAKDAPGAQPHRFPLMVAVEKSAIKGVITERGSTRIIVAGDSLFLANHQMGSAANRDFAGYALNWLLDRTQLLESIGAQPVHEYRVVMTQTQVQKSQWILLGAMPGGALLLGGLVWLRRRK
jgi:hypothetical protein